MSPELGTVGIDLGTTHTVVAKQGSVVRLSEDGPTPTLLPSAVAFPPSGGELVGWPGKARRTIDPKNTLLSTKRLMGAAIDDPRAKRFAEHHPYDLVDVQGTAAIQTRAGKVGPVAVASRILSQALSSGDIEPRGHNAVVTVPASFGRKERRATVSAARAAGFMGAHLIDEPVATAIAYLSRSNIRYGAVYDLGGGTFDLAIVDCRQFPFNVIASGGDPYLGGDDVDRELATSVAYRVLSETGWDLASESSTFMRLMSAVEAAKRSLSDDESAVVDLMAVDPAAPWSNRLLELTRRELAPIVDRVMQRSLLICDTVLGEANLRPKDIDAVFLAGGSTKLPGINEPVGNYFGKRGRKDIDPMHVVAIGASLAATRPKLKGLLHVFGTPHGGIPRVGF